jgi:hypothetical protein
VVPFFGICIYLWIRPTKLVLCFIPKSIKIFSALKLIFLIHRYRSCDVFQFAFEREISQFVAWDYIINRTLHGGLKIRLLSSRVEDNHEGHHEDKRDLTILGRQRDDNGYQYNRSLKRIEYNYNI